MMLFAKQENSTLFPADELLQDKGSNEWYTPAKYIEAARLVMGSIDLDPASCALANEVVKATRYYTQEDDGLTQDWYGNIWLNPPYGSIDVVKRGRAGQQGVAKPFIFKAIQGYEQGTITQAIVCVTTDTDAKWFLPLWEYLICFADHKVHFYRPGLPNMGQFFGTSFVYLGKNVQAFIDTFRAFGPIAKAIAWPRRETEQPRLWTGVPS